MAACKRRRQNIYMPEAPASPSTIQWTLPVDLLLEIVARSDTRTLIRCAAASRLFRRDILVPSFIDRVTAQGGIVPQCILTLLNTHDDKVDPPPPLSLVHPTTTAVVSFLEYHMYPYMSRFADDLLGEHIPVMSRGGLVLLRRRHVNDKLSNLCVYDPITGHRTFLSNPPDIGPNKSLRYHLLTSADGISGSFLLFVANLYGKLGNNRHIIEVQTATSTCGTWAPSSMIHDSSGFLKIAMHQSPVVLHGDLFHWLVRRRGEIVTYKVRTMEQGTVQLPAALSTNFKGRFYLGSYYSSDGRKLLRLLAFNGLKITMWHQLACGDWASGDVAIDMEENLQSIDPNIITTQLLFKEFKWSGEGSNTVSFRICRCGPGVKNRRLLLVVLDLEAQEMHVHLNSTPSSSSVLLDVDLPSRLRAMKLFPS